MSKLLRFAVVFATLTAFAVTTASAGTGGTERPFKGTLVGSANFPADPGCPLGFRTVSEGSGTASHLGRISMAANHCFAPPNLMTQGAMTFVAANGDELHMTYTGTCSPAMPSVPGEVITCSGQNVIVGGTGRFVGATGEAQVTGLVTFAGFGVPDWAAKWTWEGTLSY